MPTPKPELTVEEDFELRLPQEPVDGFEVEYFDIQGDYLSHIRLRFHVNTKWADVRECHRDCYGADLINQWQVFDGPRFVGRIDGWSTPLYTPHASSFHRRDDAIDALVKRFTDRAISYERMALEYHNRAAQLQEEQQ